MAIEIVDLPSKHGDVPWKKYGKSPSSMGKSTISKWAMFNSKLLNYQRVPNADWTNVPRTQTCLV